MPELENIFQFYKRCGKGLGGLWQDRTFVDFPSMDTGASSSKGGFLGNQGTRRLSQRENG